MSEANPIPWHGPTIHVIGIGLGETTPLSPAARQALAQAEVIIGARRHYAALPPSDAEQLAYPQPFEALAELLTSRRGRQICLLASGDPLLYGVGSWLMERLPREQVICHPNISSVQAAFARIALPWQDAEVISLHSRPVVGLRARLRPGQLYAVLGSPDTGPDAVAQALQQAGLETSQLWVAERLGHADERVRAFTVVDLLAEPPTVDPLHVTVIRSHGAGESLPALPGLPDDAFATGAEAGQGMITKRDVRLVVLSRLAPRPGEVGWDIGAGCGSVAVEWALWNPRGEVYAVEKRQQRLDWLRHNRQRFGVTNNLHAVEGSAPEALAYLPNPHAVFLGGSDGSTAALLAQSWARLRPGGRLVATAVTETSRATVIGFAHQHGAELTQVAVSHGEALAGHTVLRPQLPVLIMAAHKGARA